MLKEMFNVDTYTFFFYFPGGLTINDNEERLCKYIFIFYCVSLRCNAFCFVAGRSHDHPFVPKNVNERPPATRESARLGRPANGRAEQLLREI